VASGISDKREVARLSNCGRAVIATSDAGRPMLSTRSLRTCIAAARASLWPRQSVAIVIKNRSRFISEFSVLPGDTEQIVFLSWTTRSPPHGNDPTFTLTGPVEGVGAAISSRCPAVHMTSTSGLPCRRPMPSSYIAAFGLKETHCGRLEGRNNGGGPTPRRTNSPIAERGK